VVRFAHFSSETIALTRPKRGSHTVVVLHCRGALVVRHSLVKGVLADAVTRGEIMVRPVERAVSPDDAAHASPPKRSTG
jgi:hypothetical protein